MSKDLSYPSHWVTVTVTLPQKLYLKHDLLGIQLVTCRIEASFMGPKWSIPLLLFTNKWSIPLLFFTNNSSIRTQVLTYNSMRKHSKLIAFLLKDGMGCWLDLPELATDLAMPAMRLRLTSCHNLLRRKYINNALAFPVPSLDAMLCT